ncbi:ABC transporter substrate-binding protein [Taibaiella lutea]|uniref:ABC transporter substrate-binding protein n=1 Tax=Taibaiella lutea TaxID=2608001 RepID=A0A5M6CEW5_9BACT|nr:ABC transporter substrate-binding protein [Taibaiella lutea]KAA5533616.1 ABC transporter substrate-binding protein [Taibaiella lutea]
MFFRKKITFLIILLSFFAACKTHREEKKMIFRYNQIEGIETLDPAFAKSIAIMWGTHFIFNTLLEVDSGLQTVPSLAKSWECSADGLQYTFHLRNDVYFQDNDAFPNGKGRKMTAADVVYTFRRLINPDVAAAGAWVFNDRVSKDKPFQALDDTTVLITLKEPFRPLPQILTMQYCAVVPKEVVEKWGKDFRNHPCGTGPFQLKYWDEGTTMVLYKNPHYWEFDESRVRLPYLDAIQVSFNDTKALEFLLFKQKKTDFMYRIDGSMKDMVLTRHGTLQPGFSNSMNLLKHSYLYDEYIGFVMDSANDLVKNNPVRLRKIRQAINYAIDRKKIVTYFRNGIGIPAEKGGFIPSVMIPDKYKVVEGYEYNPSKALQLLAEAGFPNGKNLPVITLTVPDADVDICNFVATQLNEVGIHTEIQIMLKGLMRQMMTKNQLPFFKAGWVADYPDAETFLACFYSGFPSPPNYTQFKSKVFDDWYQQSLKINDDTFRLQLYAKMDSLVSSEAPVVPLFYDEILHFTQKNITGFQTNALNIIDLRRVKKN